MFLDQNYFDILLQNIIILQNLESNQQMTFKQKYLCQSGPFPFDFQAERQETKKNIHKLLRSCKPNQWSLRTISPAHLISWMKQVYGLKAQQLAEFINYLFEILKQPETIGDTMNTIVKTLNRFREYKINMRNFLKIDNKYFINFLKQLMSQGLKGSLKSLDGFVDEYMKLIRFYSQFGEDCILEALDLAVMKRQNKYLALFVRSIKCQQNALLILRKVFAESSLWERDICFFYIISEIIKNFPKIDYSIYYQTLFHQIIKIMTTIIDPLTEDEIKKVLNPEESLGLPSVAKSIANILINLLRPYNQPGWDTVWNCIERIFSLIASTLDHFKESQYMNDFLIIFKQFGKAFHSRYRNERKIHQIVNQDYLQQYHGEPNSQTVLNEEYCDLFNQLWPDLIPELLYLEDGDMRVSKLLNQLILFNPNKYVSLVLQQINSFLMKDLTIVSLNSCKITILFIGEYVIKNYCGSHEVTLLIQSCNSLLVALEKLGISENLDMMELVIRIFLFIPETFIQNILIQNLVEDVITILIQNIDSMSINLENTDTDDNQVYFNLKNIFLPFLLRLNKQQIKQLCDKMLYKIKNIIPEHRDAYQFLLVPLCYLNKQFAPKIIDFVFKGLIHLKTENGNDNLKHLSSNQSTSMQGLPYHKDYQLATGNEELIKWYCSLIQYSYQYNPDNVVHNWQKLEKIVTVLLRQQKNNIFDWGLDILFNFILNLTNIHISPLQFQNDKNMKYQTLGSIQWQHTSKQHINILKIIKKLFYDNIEDFIYERYKEILKSQKIFDNAKSKNNIEIANQNPKLIIKVKKFQSQVVDDFLATEHIPSLEDLVEKKIIYKLLSIQYTVFSALQQRCPFTEGDNKFNNYFIPGFSCFRSQAIPYLKIIQRILSHFHIFADPNILKIYHFFWRQAHDQFFFTNSVMTTTQKIQPYYFPHVIRKKQLFQSSFLIVQELYLAFYVRLELYCALKPIAYLNNPDYYDELAPLTLSNNVETSLKSIFPESFNPHQQYHRSVIDIFRFKISLNNPNSYICKIMNSSDKIEKQRYLFAFRNILINLKKNSIFFSMNCCFSDSALWYTILQTIDIYPYLEKKSDKSMVIQIFYVLILFNFNNKGGVFLNKNQKNIEEVRKFVKILLTRIKKGISPTMQKNLTIVFVLLMCFVEMLPLDDDLYLQAMELAATMTVAAQQIDQCNLGKTLFYHIINKVLKTKVVKEQIENFPVKRTYEQFLTYRFIGGPVIEGTVVPIDKIKVDKVDNYYEPVKKLRKIQYKPINSENRLENLILSYIKVQKSHQDMLRSLRNDLDLKQNSRSEQIVISNQDEKPKKVSHNGYKLLNYIFDSNPQKLDIFSDFVENFSSYPSMFYHRMYRKMMIFGGKQTINILKKMMMNGLQKAEKQQIKFRQFIMAQLLLHLYQDQQYIQFYTKWLHTCSNEQFQYANGCIMVIFCIDWRYNLKIYPKLADTFAPAVGRIKLRLMQLLNTFILCTGRFGRNEAVKGLKYIVKGIQEGADQVSELVVSMIIACFIIPINIELFPEWVSDSLPALLEQKKMHKIDQSTAYQIDSSLKQFLETVIARCQEEKQISSKNLKIYSKILYRILISITVYKFNDSFYDLLKPIMLFFLNKVPSIQTGLQPSDEDAYQEQIVYHLKNSEYPESIYEDILHSIMNGIESDKINVIRKKLKFMEGVVINRSFVTGKVSFPNILGDSPLSKNGKQNSEESQEKNKSGVIIEHIIAVSNIARIMTPDELTKFSQDLLAQEKAKKNINMMMATLLAAGTRQFSWRQSLLNQILKNKKQKLVKQFVSYWWKGRSPETQEQSRLYMHVRSVQNPYSYFA